MEIPYRGTEDMTVEKIKRITVISSNFYDLFIVHLGSIVINNQLDAQFLFRIYLLQFSTCFEHPCAHHQKNQLY
jgi:hypothetical protein